LVDIADLGMVSAEGRERAVLHPPEKQLGVRVALEAPDVGTDERLAGQSAAHAHRQAQPQVIPARLVVAEPVRRIPLNASEAGAGQHERALLRHGLSKAGRCAHRHQ